MMDSESTCHVSWSRCHMSLVMCCVSNVLCQNIFFLQSFGASWLRRSYQQEATPFFLFYLYLFFFILFLIKSALIPNIYFSWLVGVSLRSLKNKLTRIEFQRYWNRLKVSEITNFGGRRISPWCLFSKVKRWNQ